jgi:hypothetical protein
MFAGAESSEDLCTATSTRLSGIGAEGNRLGFELIVRPLGSWEVSKDLRHWGVVSMTAERGRREV